MAQVDSGWYLRHRDGVEHGPFRLTDLVAAADAGNIAADTTVRHESHTRGTWVLAGRVQAIATALSRRGVAGSQTTAREAPNTAEPTPNVANPSDAEKTTAATSANAPVSGPTPSSPRTTSNAGTASALGTASQATSPASATTSTATNAPGTAPKSAFRRPGGQAPTALPGSTPFRSNRQAETVAANEPEPTTETKSTQTIRLYNQAFPVPKRFADAALTLFDFRFRYFITPWIVKILWGLTVMLALLWVSKLTYDVWIQPSLEAPGPRTEDGTPRWEFEPLGGESGQSIFQSRAFGFAVQCGTIMVFVLIARMLMETAIVFFRVASDIAELKRTPPS
ncbi:MAG: DUF4282 domain-containing protein [Planctomycetota bacterium]